ncbi:MAG: hypothetical protein AAGA77_11630 [Bacteroidota bacterium]
MTLKRFIPFQALSFLFVASFIFSNCSNQSCSIDDWVGTYKGIKTCESDVTNDYTFTISRINAVDGQPTDNLVLDGFFIFIDECALSRGLTNAPGSVQTYEGSLDGDNLQVTIRTITGSCSWNATRQ